MLSLHLFLQSPLVQMYLCSKHASSFGQILLAVQHGLLHTCLVMASRGSWETEIAIVRNSFPRIALSGILLRSLELLFVFLIVLSAKRNLSLSFRLPCLNSVEASFLSFITKLLLFQHLFMELSLHRLLSFFNLSDLLLLLFSQVIVFGWLSKSAAHSWSAELCLRSWELNITCFLSCWLGTSWILEYEFIVSFVESSKRVHVAHN